MKLGEARKITAEHLSSLYQKKRELTKILQGEGVESSARETLIELKSPKLCLPLRRSMSRQAM